MSGHCFAQNLRGLRLRQMGGAHLDRVSIAMALEQPVPVEPVLELEQRLSELLDGVEGSHPEQLLLERPDEPFRLPIALRCPDKARARLDTQEVYLRLEGMAHILRAMVMPQDEAFGKALGQGAVVFPDPLVDRLQRFKACPRPGGMDADHVTDEVIHGHEHRGHALLAGGDLGRVGTSHLVRTLRDDCPLVRLLSLDGTHPVRGLQRVLAHQAPHPLLRDRDAPVPEPRPDLAVALTPEPQCLGLAQRLADPGHQPFVRHGFDLRFGKGSSPSCRAIRISRSSLSIIRFPTSRLARLSSCSRATTFGSSVRRFRAAVPPSRNSSRHQLDNPAAGWPVSRISASRLSPRSRRRTTSCFRFADQHFILLIDTSFSSHTTTKCVSRIFDWQPTRAMTKRCKGSFLCCGDYSEQQRK